MSESSCITVYVIEKETVFLLAWNVFRFMSISKCDHRNLDAMLCELYLRKLNMLCIYINCIFSCCVIVLGKRNACYQYRRGGCSSQHVRWGWQLCRWCVAATTPELSVTIRFRERASDAGPGTHRQLSQVLFTSTQFILLFISRLPWQRWAHI